MKIIYGQVKAPRNGCAHSVRFFMPIVLELSKYDEQRIHGFAST